MVQLDHFSKNVDNSEENVYISSKNADIFEQSKKEEIKKEKSILNESESNIKMLNRNIIESYTPPTLEEIQNYCKERNNNIDAERFLYYCQSRGWRINGEIITDWKAYLRGWEKLEDKYSKKEDEEFALLRTKETSEEFEKRMWEKMQA